MAITREEFDKRLREKGVGDAELARLRGEFFKEVVRPRLKGQSREQRAPVLEEWANKAAAPARPAGFKAGLERGFKSNLTGATIAAARGEAPAEHDMGFFDAATDLYQNFGNRMTGPGRLAGLTEAAGETIGSLADPAGLAVDVATAKMGGKLAATLVGKLAPVSAKAARRAAGLAVPVAAATSGAIQGGGTALAQGGTTEDALRAGAMGAVLAGGMAARGRPKAAPAKPKAKPAAAPLRALPPGPEEAGRLAEFRAQGMSTREIIAEQRSRAAAKRPGPDGLLPAPKPEAAAPAGPPLALPERSQVNVPPGGFKPDALTAKVGEVPDAPAPPRPAFETAARIEAAQARIDAIQRALKSARKPKTVAKLSAELVERGRELARLEGGEIPAPAVAAPATAPPTPPAPVARPPAVDPPPSTAAPTAPASDDRLASLMAERSRVIAIRDNAKTARGYAAANRQIYAIEDQITKAGGKPAWMQLEDAQPAPAAAARTVPEQAPAAPPARPADPEPPAFLRDPDAPAAPRSLMDEFGSVFAEDEARRAARRRELGLDEAPPARPTEASGAGGAGGVLRQIARDEGGSATVEGAFGLPAFVAGAAGRAARAAVDPLLNAADAGAQAARQVEATAVERPLQAIADATGISRAGEAFVNWKDKKKRQAGETPGLRAFISDAGLPAGYGELRDEVTQGARRDLAGLASLADDLDQNLDAAGQVKAYEDATTPGATSPEADRIRAATTPISRELRDLGALTPGQYAEWEGNYLPRSYLDKLDSELAQNLAKVVRAVRGSKHRGKKQAISAKQMELYSRPWEEVGVTADGRVLIRDANNGTTASVPRKRVGDFTGTWKELGRKKDGTVTAWRDWTPTEREAMGEVKNASVALRKMATQARRDLTNGRLLDEVARNPEWARPALPGATPPDGWVHISNERTPTGAQKWGNLSDHYVHPAIARDLKDAIDLAANLRDFQSLFGMQIWKKAKTVYNVASHVNNFMVNVPTLELAGGSVWDLPAAAKVLKDKGADFQAMTDAGLFDDSYAASEFAASLAGSAINWRNPIAAAVEMGRRADAFATGTYQAGDDIFRAAYVLGRMRDGLPVDQAVAQARKDFYSGSRINSRFARAGSATVLPFIKPWIYALDKMPELAARNPAKAAKLLLYYQAAQMAMKAASGDTDDQIEGRNAMLPDYQQGPGKVQWTPLKDSRGQRLMLDVQNWSPINFLDTTERTALPEWEIPGVTEATGLKAGWPSALTPGGPLGTLLAVGSNYDPFYQKQLRDATGNRTGEFLARELGPATITTHAGKLAAALQGRADYGGRHYDVPTAAANVLGVKLQPFNPDEAYAKLAGGFEREANEIEAAGRSNDRLLARGTISEAEHAAEAERLNALYQALAERATKRLTTAEKGLPAPAPAGGR